MAGSREYWRGVLDWKNDGITLSTASNEAAKMYDASVTQFIGWFDDKSVGGLESTLDAAIKADPDFVMGHCLAVGLQLMSTGDSVRTNPNLKNQVEDLRQLAKKKAISKCEDRHVEAVLKLADGNFYGASQCWEDVLIECPTDIVAVKLAQDTYFYLGLQEQLRDSVARVVPFWQSRSIPLKGYLHGLYAFGLEETKFYQKAEAEAKKGLERVPQDGWATHALAHVYEMEGRFDEGIDFLKTTMDNWMPANYLAIHNLWHYALYFIDKGDYEYAFEILDTHILTRPVEKFSMLDIVDGTSLLYRLGLTDQKQRNNSSRWETLYNICKPHFKEHVTTFNDAHFMMSILGSKKEEDAEELISSVNQSENMLGKHLAVPILKAMVEFDRENYKNAVDLLLPIRYDIVDIGGSDAQRDLFNQLLLKATIKSPLDCHRKLAARLLIEKQALKNSPLMGRLINELNH